MQFSKEDIVQLNMSPATLINKIFSWRFLGQLFWKYRDVYRKIYATEFNVRDIVVWKV